MSDSRNPASVVDSTTSYAKNKQDEQNENARWGRLFQDPRIGNIYKNYNDSELPPTKEVLDFFAAFEEFSSNEEFCPKEQDVPPSIKPY